MWTYNRQVNKYKSTTKLKVGDTFKNGDPSLGQALYKVVQRLSDGTLILYRMNNGRRDERNRFYELGGVGKGSGMKKIND